jgi:hypothetical protein
VRTAVGAAVAVVALLLTACSGGSDADPAAAPSVVPSASSSMHQHGSDAAAAAGAAAASDPAVEAAVRLESLLGEHAVLVADMMRARIRSDADLAQQADSAVGENTKALGQVLKPVVGDDGATQFAELWSAHVQMLFDYSRGLSTNDKGLQKSSRKKLTAYETRLADFFVAGSKGRLPRRAAVAAVKEHINHLLEGADAYADQRYRASAALYRASYAHTFMLGSTLAHVLLPESVGKKLDSPQVQLRTSLTQVLGEHVALAIAAMRSAAGDPKDFTAMGNAVNGNTLDLTKAIDGLFGPKAAAGFQSQWADHVDELMQYTSATVRGQAEKQQVARVKLRTFESDFSTFLNSATENRLGRKALAQAFVGHDRMLLAEIDAYAAKDYAQAHDLADQTYEDMYGVAGQLASAIGATLAGDLPKGGSQTGGGGTARLVP